MLDTAGESESESLCLWNVLRYFVFQYQWVCSSGKSGHLNHITDLLCKTDPEGSGKYHISSVHPPGWNSFLPTPHPTLWLTFPQPLFLPLIPPHLWGTSCPWTSSEAPKGTAAFIAHLEFLGLLKCEGTCASPEGAVGMQVCGQQV